MLGALAFTAILWRMALPLVCAGAALLAMAADFRERAAADRAGVDFPASRCWC
jgi:hypothetical protein